MKEKSKKEIKSRKERKKRKEFTAVFTVYAKKYFCAIMKRKIN